MIPQWAQKKNALLLILSLKYSIYNEKYANFYISEFIEKICYQHLLKIQLNTHRDFFVLHLVSFCPSFILLKHAWEEVYFHGKILGVDRLSPIQKSKFQNTALNFHEGDIITAALLIEER